MATTKSASALKAARYGAYLNGSYHADREGILDRRHRWMMFLVVALGASSVVAMAGDWASVYFGVASALIGAVDLAFGFSIRARNHAYLRKEYFRIASALANGKCTADDAEAKMMELAAEEEPIFKAAHSVAANWAIRAVYGDAARLPCKVGWFRRLFRHWLLMTDVDFSTPP